MARPSVFSVEDKYRLVLAVISGEVSVVEAARRGKASEQSISTWKRQFLEGGKAGLVEGGKPGLAPRDRASDPSALSESEREELGRLRKEVAELRLEREILRKAAAYFGRESIR